MRHPVRTLAAMLAGAAFASAFLIYCGADPAANADADAGTSATGGTVLEAACDKLAVRTTGTRPEKQGDLPQQIDTTHYAEIQRPGLKSSDPIVISAVGCALTCPDGGTCGRELCPRSAVCSGFAPPEFPQCERIEPSVLDGRVLINCGTEIRRFTWSNGDGVVNESHYGMWFTTATVRILP